MSSSGAPQVGLCPGVPDTAALHWNDPPLASGSAVLCALCRRNAQFQMSAAHGSELCGSQGSPQAQLSILADGWTVHILTSPSTQSLRPICS